MYFRQGIIVVFALSLCHVTLASESDQASAEEPSLIEGIARLPFDAVETVLERFFELSDLVLSGTRIISPFEDYVAENVSSTTVITAEDIELYGARNLPEAIQYSEGVVLSDLVGNGEEPTLDFRNFNEGQDVAVLIDGVRINEVKSNNINYPLIPMSMIERIEISRGGDSFLYGEGATGGTVHVMTKSPKPGIHSEASVRAGSFDERGVNFETQVGKDGLVLFLAGDYYETNGFRRHSSVEKSSFFSKIGKDIQEHLRIEGAYLYSDAHLDRPGSVRETLIRTGGRETSERPRNFADLNSHLGYLSFQSVFRDQLAISGNIFKSKTNEISVANFATFDTNDNELDAQRESWGYVVQAHHSKEWGSFVDGIVLGIDYQENEIDEVDFNRSKVTLERLGTTADLVSQKDTLGLFGMVDVSWRERIGLKFGLRYDDVEFENNDLINTANNVPVNESRVSYSVGTAARVWRKLHASMSYSSSFKTPSLSDLYGNPGFGGNPSLKPEESKTHELGLRWEDEGFELATTLFANTLKNEIGFDSNDTDSASALL